MIARNIRINGHVQGVFFRNWAVQTARAIGVEGWVRNRQDGSIEVMALGDEDLVSRFVERLREGSPASRVDHVEVSEAPVERLYGFARRPTA